MARSWLTSFDKVAPVMALCLVGFSIVHPGASLREMRAVVTRCDAIESENASLRSQLVAVVDFLRNTPLLSASPSENDDGTLDAGPSSVQEPAPVSVPGLSYMVVRGVPCLRRGSDYWYPGDLSPWGVVDTVYRGGFIADNRRFIMERVENVE